MVRVPRSFSYSKIAWSKIEKEVADTNDGGDNDEEGWKAKD